MTYERLADFVKNHMRMSHVYQPAMLLTLLRGDVEQPEEGMSNASPDKIEYR